MYSKIWKCFKLYVKIANLQGLLRSHRDKIPCDFPVLLAFPVFFFIDKKKRLVCKWSLPNIMNNKTFNKIHEIANVYFSCLRLQALCFSTLNFPCVSG